REKSWARDQTSTRVFRAPRCGKRRSSEAPFGANACRAGRLDCKREPQDEQVIGNLPLKRTAVEGRQVKYVDGGLQTAAAERELAGDAEIHRGGELGMEVGVILVGNRAHQKRALVEAVNEEQRRVGDAVGPSNHAGGVDAERQIVIDLEFGEL